MTRNISAPAGCVAEVAAFIHGVKGMTGLDFLPYPPHQPGIGEAPGGLDMLMIALDNQIK